MSKLGYWKANNKEMWAATAVAFLNFKWKYKGVLFCFRLHCINSERSPSLL